MLLLEFHRGLGSHDIAEGLTKLESQLVRCWELQSHGYRRKELLHLQTLVPFSSFLLPMSPNLEKVLPRLRANLSPESLSLRSVICEIVAASIFRNMAIYLFIIWLDLLVYHAQYL